MRIIIIHVSQNRFESWLKKIVIMVHGADLDLMSSNTLVVASENLLKNSGRQICIFGLCDIESDTKLVLNKYFLCWTNAFLI